MKKNHSERITLPENFPSIEDAEITSHTEYPPIKAGKVENWEDTAKCWEQLEYAEKAKVRSHITSAVLVIWSIWVIVGLIHFAITGDYSVLVASPVLLSVPLYQILRFYYTKR